MDAKLKDLIRRRMETGDYIICDRSRLDEALAAARPGDTISLHPDAGDGPPTLYEMGRRGTLRKLDPEVD